MRQGLGPGCRAGRVQAQGQREGLRDQMGGQSSREGARGGEGGGGSWGTDVLRPRCPSHLREDVGGAGAGAPGESPLELCSLCTETGGEPWSWRRWPGREGGERMPDRAGQHHGCPRPWAVTQLSSPVPRGRTWPRRGQSSTTIPRHRHAPDPPRRGGGAAVDRGEGHGAHSSPDPSGGITKSVQIFVRQSYPNTGL